MPPKPTYEELEKRLAELESQVARHQAAENRNPPEMLPVLLEAFQHIPLCKSFEDAAKMIFDQCKQLTGARSGYVALLSADGEENEVLFLDAGGLPCDVDPDLPMPIRGLREVAYRTQAVAYDNEFPESPWVEFMPRGHVRLDNVLFAPLNIEESTVGVIGIANKPGGFNEQDVNIAAIMGDLAAIALTYAKAQDSLRRKDQFLEAIYNGISHSIFVVDVLAGGEFRYAGLNPQHEELTGNTNDSIRGKTPHDVFPEDAAQTVIAHYRECVHANQPITYEEWLPFRGNLTCWETTLHPQISKTGHVYRIVGKSQEITKRKETENELKESEAKFRALVENAPMSIMMLRDGKYVYGNPASVRLLGLRGPEEIIGLNALDTIEPEFHATLLNRMKNLEAGKNNPPVEIKIRRPDGECLWTISTSVPVQMEGRQTVIIVGQDISKQKQMETQIRQTQKLESIGTLAGGIAHDFNNILYPIIGMAEMLMEDLPSSSLEYDNAVEIYQAGKRGSQLVKQILAFSRQTEKELIPVGVQKILKEVLTLSRSTIPSNIEIIEDIQSDCGLVMAEPTQIHQVAMNLITNAYHAVEETDGQILVGLKEVELKRNDTKAGAFKPGRYVQLAVSDTGHGIDPKIMNKIFDPYFTTKKKGRGTGLGLAMVHGIIQALKGNIMVSSEPSKGTRFTILLPLFERQPKEERVSEEGTLPTGTERILLVDDEKSIVRLERNILERLGYQVSAQVSSVQALEIFKANPTEFDMVLSDMTMPDMTGDRLAKRMLSIRKNIPIIICTGFSEKIDREKAKEMGIKGFLMKPIKKSAIAQMIRKVLDESRDNT